MTLVVCIGGDGTLNEVVAGLCSLPRDKRPPVGYIPAGTTNDFAASIGLPSDPGEAAKFMMNAKARQMDCGRLDGHVFNYVASFGAFTEDFLRNAAAAQEYARTSCVYPGGSDALRRHQTDEAQV